MIVRIDNKVHAEIELFYTIAMQLHPTLDESVVLAKKERLYAAIRSLEYYAYIYPKARYKRSWIDARFRIVPHGSEKFRKGRS